MDVSIIGGPPRTGYSPHFYASGPEAAQVESLNDFGLTVLNLGGEVGQASGIKMCYAAMTKGSWALYTQLLMAAEMMGLTEPLLAEFQSGQQAMLQRMERGLPTVPPRSRRWVSEMEEIRDTFAGLGMTPSLFEGVAEMYRFIGSTPLGEEFRSRGIATGVSPTPSANWPAICRQRTVATPVRLDHDIERRLPHTDGAETGTLRTGSGTSIIDTTR